MAALLPGKNVVSLDGSDWSQLAVRREVGPSSRFTRARGSRSVRNVTTVGLRE